MKNKKHKRQEQTTKQEEGQEMSRDGIGAIGADLIAKVSDLGVDLPDELQSMVLKTKEEQEKESAEREEHLERIKAKARTVINLEDEASQHKRRGKRIKRRIKNLEPSELDLPDDLRERISNIESALEKEEEGSKRSKLRNELQSIKKSDKYRLYMYQKREDLEEEIERIKGLVEVCNISIDQLLSDNEVAKEYRVMKAKAVLGGLPEQKADVTSKLQLIHQDLNKTNKKLIEATDVKDRNRLLAKKEQLEDRKRALLGKNKNLLETERINKMIVSGCPTCILCHKVRTPQQTIVADVTRLWKEGSLVTTRLSREIIPREDLKSEELKADVCKYHLEQTFTSALVHRGIEAICAKCGGSPGNGKCKFGGEQHPQVMFRRPIEGEKIDFTKPFNPERETLVCPKENARIKEAEGLKCSGDSCGRSFNYLYSIDDPPDQRNMYPKITKNDPGAREKTGLCRSCLRKYKAKKRRKKY